jgi:hypothetical protein
MEIDESRVLSIISDRQSERFHCVTPVVLSRMSLGFRLFVTSFIADEYKSIRFYNYCISVSIPTKVLYHDAGCTAD